MTTYAARVRQIEKLVGKLVELHTPANGTCRAIIIGVERKGKNGRDVVDYKKVGDEFGNWCYVNELTINRVIG